MVRRVIASWLQDNAPDGATKKPIKALVSVIGLLLVAGELSVLNTAKTRQRAVERRRMKRISKKWAISFCISALSTPRVFALGVRGWFKRVFGSERASRVLGGNDGRCSE